MESPHLSIRNLSKRFGKKVVLDEINLTIDKGEYLVILGPTGAGKTTLLKIIAGLIPPTKGSIEKSNEELDKIPPEDRNMAYLPQTSDYSLFPYMNVWSNTLFSPRMKGEKSLEEINSLGNEVLDLVNLRHRYNAFPVELSGGMKQRVALARAIAADTDIFLLDEPLRALDARLRIIIRSEIRKLVSDLKKTTLWVTHDQEEALAVADRILILNEGKIVQHGSPEEIYHHPQTLFAAYFFGVTNLIPASLNKKETEIISFAVGNHTIDVSSANSGKSEEKEPSNDEYVLAFKADKVDITGIARSEETSSLGSNTYIGTIREVYFLGKWGQMMVSVEGIPKEIAVLIPSKRLEEFRVQTKVEITIAAENITFFKEPWHRIKQLEEE